MLVYQEKIAINNCVFIPTPKGYYKKDGSIVFRQGYLKSQFDIIMNIVEKSNERILLAPLWYNPVTNAEHNVHNVFLSIDVNESKKCKCIVGHCIDTLNDLEKWFFSGCSLMEYGWLNENDIKGIIFINTYNLQGNKGKTCTNFTEANIFLAANIIANNPNIDYCDFFSIISSKTIQILSVKQFLIE